MKIRLQGKEVDTANLGEVRIEVADLGLASLSAAALFELRRCFVSNARKSRRGFCGAVKRGLRPGIQQLAAQLDGEAERRRHSEPGPAAPVIVVLKSVEAAGYLAAFLGGLAEIYVAERAKVAPQSALERSIADVKSAAFECSGFCRSIAAAIYQTELSGG